MITFCHQCDQPTEIEGSAFCEACWEAIQLENVNEEVKEDYE